MENTQNRNDIYNFFKDMPEHLQKEAINKMKQQIKKPPDSNPYQYAIDFMRDDIQEFEERK